MVLPLIKQAPLKFKRLLINLKKHIFSSFSIGSLTHLYLGLPLPFHLKILLVILTLKPLHPPYTALFSFYNEGVYYRYRLPE